MSQEITVWGVRSIISIAWFGQPEGCPYKTVMNSRDLLLCVRETLSISIWPDIEIIRYFVGVIGVEGQA